MTEEQILKLDQLRKEHRELDDYEKAITEYSQPRTGGSGNNRCFAFYDGYNGGYTRLLDSMLPIIREDFISMYKLKIKQRKEAIIKEIESL